MMTWLHDSLWPFGQKYWFFDESVTDGPTDGRIDQPTDGRIQLKRCEYAFKNAKKKGEKKEDNKMEIDVRD